jgi:hypothetical protein
MSEHLPAPVSPELAEYMRMAWSGLASQSPAARRVEAAEAAQGLLAEALTVPLAEMSHDELVTAVLYLRAGLARLLGATIPTAVAPAPTDDDNDEALDDVDLIAHLLELIGDTEPLEADIAIHLGRPLPAHLITLLAQAIHAPGLRTTGDYLEARGVSGSSTIHLTALTAREA